MKILLTNTGRRTYLLNFFLKLQKKYNLKIFISDPSKYVPTFYLDKRIKSIKSPKSEDVSKYISFIKKIVHKKKIKAIIPISDFELEIFTKQKNYFLKRGVKILISKKEVVDICINKKMLKEFCDKNNFLSPEIYKSKKDFKYPMIIKKIKGFGSKGLKVIKKRGEFVEFNKKTYFAQKYINGEEYGIDILNDLKGNFIDCTIKKKILMRAGETDKSKITNNRSIGIFCKKLSSKLKHVGNLDVDIIMKKKKIFIIDLNPRFGGGYPCTHLSGKNYIDFLIRELIGLKNKKFSVVSKKIFLMKGISIHTTNA